MDIDSMRLFREVASRGSFTDAARRCFMSQQALSRKVSAMESELGQKLLNRTTPLGLTPAGKVVLRESNTILSSYDRMTHTLQELKTRAPGVVRLHNYGTGSFASLYTGVLERANDRYPEIDIQFVKVNEDDIVLLQEGAIDIGFVRTVARDGSVSLSMSPDMDYMPLRYDIAPLIFGVRKGHPLAHLSDATLAEIAQYPLAMPTDTNLGALPLAVKRLFADSGLYIDVEDVYCSSASEHFFEFFSGMSELSTAFFTDWSFDDYVPDDRLGTRRLVKLTPGPEKYEVRGYVVALRESSNPAVKLILDIMREVDESLGSNAGH